MTFQANPKPLLNPITQQSPGMELLKDENPGAKEDAAGTSAITGVMWGPPCYILGIYGQNRVCVHIYIYICVYL